MAEPARARARLRLVLIATLVPSAPPPASAHASERMVILTLPTGYYIAGAALVVAVTGLLGALAPRLPRVRPRCLATRRTLLPVELTGTVACLALLTLIGIGFRGSRDPLENPLSLAIWTLLWVGLTLVTMLVGNLWRDLDPWTGPARLARRALRWRRGIGLERLGYLPAVAGLLAFTWFELVSLAPDDPAVLARAVLAYWLLVLILAVLDGPEWLRHGEFLTVFFGFIARIAPFWAEPAPGGRLRIMAGLPGAQVLAMPSLPPGAVAFLTLVLAGISFDGLKDTFWWLARIGVNPLDFPGRSAVMAANSVGLLATWALTAAAILGTIAAGRWLAGATGRFWPAAGRGLLAFLPIAAGYHAAHYLVALLTSGQYAIAALNDPLERGWSLLGLPEDWVSFGFLNRRSDVLAIWNLQVAIILGAHLVAVILGLKLAAPGTPWRAHLPATALMVAYTVLGLWLLATPAAG